MIDMEQTTVTYSCPNCGAGLVFDAEKGKFACEFCLSEFAKDELDAAGSAQQAREREARDEDFRAQMRAYFCPSCGAELICEATTAATSPTAPLTGCSVAPKMAGMVIALSTA